ncbi:MAG: hypothetical protein WC876_00965 [Candidatus Thermoplasmatota archaeon]|jgi:hypothetical protein
MNKTLPLMMIALTAVALVAAPSASACQYYGPAAPTVNYAYCDGGAASDGMAAVAFVQEEAARTIAFVLETVDHIPLP